MCAISLPGNSLLQLWAVMIKSPTTKIWIWKGYMKLHLNIFKGWSVHSQVSTYGIVPMARTGKLLEDVPIITPVINDAQQWVPTALYVIPISPEIATNGNHSIKRFCCFIWTKICRPRTWVYNVTTSYLQCRSHSSISSRIVRLIATAINLQISKNEEKNKGLPNNNDANMTALRIKNSNHRDVSFSKKKRSDFETKS